MFNISLRGRPRPDDGDSPVNGHAHEERAPLAPWSEREGVREIRHYKVDPRGPRPPDRLPGRLLGVAGVVIFAALIGAAFVAYESQRLFALAHNHKGAAAAADQWRAVIIAGLPDAGWVAMAMVALVAALRGQSSLRARVGVLIFFGLSLGAQVLYAPPTPEGILVAVIAPITMAWMLETFIVEVRRWAMARRSGGALDETPILTGVLFFLVRILRAVVGLVLWLARLLIAWRSTTAGLRDWILDTAPLAPGRTLASIRAAEAESEASTAAAVAEQVRTAAAEERRMLEAAAAQTQQESAGQVAEAQAAAVAEIERVRAEAAEQLRAAREAVSAAKAETAKALTAAQAEAEKRDQAEEAATSLGDQLRRTEDYLARAGAEQAQLQASYNRLASTATGRERLLAAYEQLRVSGDKRFADRSAVPEVARSLYEDAGLQRPETARTYLHEHLDSLGVPRQMTQEGGSI